MEKDTRRSFVGKLAASAALLTGAPELLAQQSTNAGQSTPGTATSQAPGSDALRRVGNHIYNGVFHFSGTGANDGYGKDDHVLVTDPFEKHVTRTLDALKRSIERAGSNMDNIIHLDIFVCLPLADTTPTPTGKARFEAHKAQYDALNKIYGTYFSQGRAPSRACMAVEWIPGDSLIEIVGNALVVNAPASPVDK